MIFVQGYIWNKDSHLNAKPIVDYIGYKDTLIAIDTNIIAISSYWKYYYTTKHDDNIHANEAYADIDESYTMLDFIVTILPVIIASH